MRKNITEIKEGDTIVCCVFSRTENASSKEQANEWGMPVRVVYEKVTARVIEKKRVDYDGGHGPFDYPFHGYEIITDAPSMYQHYSFSDGMPTKDIEVVDDDTIETPVIREISDDEFIKEPSWQKIN